MPGHFDVTTTTLPTLAVHNTQPIQFPLQSDNKTTALN